MIKQLYRPIQPAVQPEGDHVIYREFLPVPKLQKFIHCYWQLKTTKKLKESFHYRVVADGCMDIFFELANPEKNYVMGFSTAYTEFPLEHTFNYIGIRFYPTGFPQIFNINASELTNRFESLNNVSPSVSGFIANHFEEMQTTQQIKMVLDNYFIDRVSSLNMKSDTRLFGAIEIILKAQGILKVEQDLDIGLSSRQLRRLFNFYVGGTAKTFSKVVRFQNILNAKPSTGSLRNNKLFFDAGYYDQAHFIKEFKTLSGYTPAKAFDR